MRTFAKVIIGINILFVIWIVAGVGGTDDYCDDPDNRGVLTVGECEAARGVGTGLGVALICGLWGFTDIILLVLYLVTQPKAETVVVYADRPPEDA